MAEEEVVLAWKERTDVHLFDAEQQVAVGHVFPHFGTCLAVGIVWIGAGVARLHHKLIDRIATPKHRNLRRCQRDTVVNGDLRLTYQSDFHYFRYIFSLI